MQYLSILINDLDHLLEILCEEILKNEVEVDEIRRSFWIMDKIV